MTSKPERENDPKKDDINVGQLTVYQKDVPKEVEDLCVNASTNALRSYYKAEITHFDEIAEVLKTALEKHQQGAWHVVVGKNFGAFVSHETKSLFYYAIGHVIFLVYKHG